MHHMPGKGFTFRHTLAVAQRNRARRLQQQQPQQQQQQPQALPLEQAPEQVHEPEPAAEEALILAMVEDLHDILDTPENPVIELPAPTIKRTLETPVKPSQDATQHQLTATQDLPPVPPIRRAQTVTFNDEAATSDLREVTNKVEMNYGDIPEIHLNALKGENSMTRQPQPATPILPSINKTKVPPVSPVPSTSSIGSGIVTITSDTSSSPPSDRAQDFNKEVIHEIIHDSNSTDSFHSAPSTSVSSEDSVKADTTVLPEKSEKLKKKSKTFSTESFLGPISKISVGSRLLAQRIVHSSLPSSSQVQSSAPTPPEITPPVIRPESPVQPELPVLPADIQVRPKSPTKSQDLLQDTKEVCLLCTSSAAVWQLTEEQRANLRCTCETDTTLVTEPSPPVSAPPSPLAKRSTRQKGQPKGRWDSKTHTFLPK